MTFYLIIISTIMEGIKIIHTLINTDYLVYKTINSIFIKKAGLKYINIFIKKLIKIGKKEDHINKIIKIEIDINEYK